MLWNTFFDRAFNFSMALDKIKTTLTLFAISLLVFSYLHHFEMHGISYDKLLQASTVSKLMTQVVSDEEE